MTKVAADARRPRIISIRWIVAGAAIALTSVSVLLVGGFGERRTRAALTRELEARLVLEARNLALTSSGALLTEFPELTLQPILAEMRRDISGFVEAVVVDHQNIVRAHPDARVLGQPHLERPESEDVPTSVGLHPGERLLADATTLAATAPVRHSGGEPIGQAWVVVRRDAIDSVIRDARRNQYVLLAALLAAGIVSSFVLMSVLLRPISTLREGLERIGRGELNAPVRLRDRTEFGLLAETMNEMAARLRVAQSQMVEKERLARELELAREIQSSLLPASGYRTGEFVAEGSHRDAAEVGGDFYDIAQLPDGTVALAIADVSGKGLAGCLVAAMLSALLGAFRGEGGSPRSTLLLLERYIVRTLRPGTFITMFYGVLDPRNGRLTYVSAGHSPLLVWRAKTGVAEYLRSGGIPLGAVRGSAFAKTLEERTVELEPGDVVVQYTDGVNEAFDPSGNEQFGFDRLRRVVESSSPAGCRAVIDTVRASIARWTADAPPFDDETLLVLSREGIADATTRIQAPALGAPHSKDIASETLAHARRAGEALALPANLDALSAIGEWISARPDLGELSTSQRVVLETALYEACANVVEHGYGGDASQKIELWWIPTESAAAPPATSPATDRAVAARVRGGKFVMLDHGTPFSPRPGDTVDFRDPAVRKRGRGLGLEILRGAMSEVTILPDTPEGNVTILRFDPERIRAEEEVRHVS